MEICLQILPSVWEHCLLYPRTLALPLIIILYIWYYKTFSYYVILDKKSRQIGKVNKGKAPPFSNGWYAIMKSSELVVGQVVYKDLHGENMVFFRGKNKQVYALDAYCPHLGANLAVGGIVVNESCIQCPFHAWRFDGKTGYCVDNNSDALSGKKIQITSEKDCNMKVKEEAIKVNKFPTTEKNGQVYVYFDNSTSYKNGGSIPYQPLDLQEYVKRLDNRGTAISTFQCNMSEIIQNTADYAHSLYVHNKLVTGFSLVNLYLENFVFVVADDKDLSDKLINKTLINQRMKDYRQKLISDFVTDDNKKYLAFFGADLCTSFGASKTEFHRACVTGIQLGGLIYAFYVSDYFEVVQLMSFEPKEKFLCIAREEFYMTKSLPYWFSALLMHSEHCQAVNDAHIWENKRFAYQPFLKNCVSDSNLLEWFTYYNQFYEGCKDKKEAIDW